MAAPYYSADPHRYRPDIDGLRAIAVVLVVVYHAKLGWADGGFVGVDVFFVISGYLITSIIWREQQAGRFTLLNFYERRVRRILPALLLVSLATMTYAWFVMLPADYAGLARSVVMTFAFASNVWFMTQTGYFNDTNNAPFLHTWSLGVEEQFYIVFPLLMMLAIRWRRPHAMVLMLAISLVLSLAAAIVMTHVRARYAFYLTPLRAWELLAGSILAVTATGKNWSRSTSEFAAVAGMSSIILSGLLLTPDIPFPGIAAIPAVAGSFLLIASGRSGEATITKLLASGPFVFIGKISYSLYLWHFPILVLLFYQSPQHPSSIAIAGAIALSIALSVLSWHFVERPFRDPRRFTRAKVFACTGAAACLVCVASGAVAMLQGIPGRLTGDDLTIASAASDYNADRERCLNGLRRGDSLEHLCQFGDPAKPPIMLLWGDSHGEAWRAAFHSLALRHSVSGYFVGAKGCPPLLFVDRPEDPSCQAGNSKVISILERNPSINRVIIAARWPAYVEGTLTAPSVEPAIRLRLQYVGSQTGRRLVENEAVVASALEATATRLNDLRRKVWVLGPVPEVWRPVPRHVFFSRRSGNAFDGIGVRRSDFDQRNARSIGILDDISSRGLAKIVHVHDHLCSQQSCLVRYGGAVLYHDGDHLSNAGAKALADAIASVFE